MYYEDIIYPLQDKIFSVIEKSRTPFYLTGGTALSRFYFNHRYSDDLDFFVNDDQKFNEYLNIIFTNLKREGIEFEIKVKDEKFSRIIVKEKLKIEFVNDIPFYLGDTVTIKNASFSRIDNLNNILSNKITSFRDREEVKDIVDIREIANKIKPDWEIIFSAANSKAAGIFPPEIAEKMDRFNPDLIDKIKWIRKPDKDEFTSDIKRIIDEILKVK